MKRRISSEEQEFTPEMRDELLNLQKLIDAGDTGSDFPWARYENLQERERWSTPSRGYVRQYGSGGYLRTEGAKDGLMQPDYTQAKELDAQANSGAYEAHTNTVSPLLDTPLISHELLAVSPTANEAPTSVEPVAKKVAPAPSLESLCKGSDDKRRGELAAKFDAMWSSVKNKNRESDYRTACTAVYKVAEWLGMVHKDTKAREWTAMLFEQYGITVSEALSKYTIKKPPTSTVFKQAVRDAFAFAEQHMAPMAKKHALPSIYQ